MRKVLGTFAVLAAILLVAGCSKAEEKADKPEEKPAEKPEEKPAEPEKTPDPKDTTAEDAAATMKNEAKNCPSSLPDTNTVISVEDGKLIVAIEGKDGGAINLVKQKAGAHKHIPPNKAEKVEHSAKGTGGGGLGLCPMLMPDTTAEVEETERGVKVTLTPTDPAKLDELKASADKRLADLMKMFRQKKKPDDSLGHGSGGGAGGGGGFGGGGSKGEASKHKDEKAGAGAAVAPEKAEDAKKAAKKKKAKKKKAKKDEDSGW